MPILSSQSGISAKAMGLTSSPYSAIGGGYWANYVYKAAPSYSMNVALRCSVIDASGNLYIGARVDQVDGTAYVYKIDTTGSLVWQTSLGTIGTVEAFDTIALDSSGNVYAAGYSTIGNGVLIAKFDTSGTLQWQRTIINNWTGSTVSDIKVDSSGNIYICGQVYVGTTTPTYDAFIMKLNSTATSITWQRFLSSASGDQYSNQLALDSTESNIYLVGSDTAISPFYGYLAKYSSAGVLQWQRKLSNNVYTYSVRLDASDNVYISGFVSGTPYGKGYIGKYNSSGVLQWGKDLSLSYSNTYSTDIKLDSSNNIYVCNTISALNTGYGVTKLDNSGNILWSREIKYGAGSVGKNVQPIGTDIISTGFYLSGTIGTQTNCKFPGDGSRTGLYDIPFGGPDVLYTGLAMQILSNSWTDQSGTLTDSAGNFSAPVTSSLTAATGFLGSLKVT